MATIPWAKIDASLKAASAPGDALLGPGGSLSLSVEVESTRFSNAQAAEAGLSEAIREGLAAQGISSFGHAGVIPFILDICGVFFFYPVLSYLAVFL